MNYFAQLPDLQIPQLIGKSSSETRDLLSWTHTGDLYQRCLNLSYLRHLVGGNDVLILMQTVNFHKGWLKGKQIW